MVIVSIKNRNLETICADKDTGNEQLLKSVFCLMNCRHHIGIREHWCEFAFLWTKTAVPPCPLDENLCPMRKKQFLGDFDTSICKVQPLDSRLWIIFKTCPCEKVET
jgi:hypothetical protein